MNLFSSDLWREPVASPNWTNPERVEKRIRPKVVITVKTNQSDFNFCTLQRHEDKCLRDRCMYEGKLRILTPAAYRLNQITGKVLGVIPERKKNQVPVILMHLSDWPNDPADHKPYRLLRFLWLQQLFEKNGVACGYCCLVCNIPIYPMPLFFAKRWASYWASYLQVKEAIERDVSKHKKRSEALSTSTLFV